jgi:hypothetical protein
MVLLPFNFIYVSLPLALISISFLIANELSSVQYGSTSRILDRRILRNVALFTTILFLVTVCIRVIDIINGA